MVNPLDTTTCQPRVSTALLDAIGCTIKSIGKQLAESPEKDSPGKVTYSVSGVNTSSASFSRKIRSSRHMMQERSSPEDLLTADADLSTIVKEES